MQKQGSGEDEAELDEISSAEVTERVDSRLLVWKMQLSTRRREDSDKGSGVSRG